MARYIDADALKRKLIDEKNFFPAIVARALEEMPTPDVVAVTHAEWLGKPTAGYSTVICSRCKTFFRENRGKWKYCPNCGAKMDGGGKE